MHSLCLQNSLLIIWVTSSFSCGVLLMTSWRRLQIPWSTSFTLSLCSWVMWRGTYSRSVSPVCLQSTQRGTRRGNFRRGTDLCSHEWVYPFGKAQSCL